MAGNPMSPSELLLLYLQNKVNLSSEYIRSNRMQELFIKWGSTPGKSSSCKSLTWDMIFVGLMHQFPGLAYNRRSQLEAGRGAFKR